MTYAILEIAIHRLWVGKLMQSLASKPWMCALLGINVSLGLTLSVMFAFFLAGFAGGLMLPLQSLSPQLGDAYLLYGFFAIIIGGLGNIRGAMLGAILLGLVNSLNTILLPQWPGIAIYVVLAVFLFFRPEGLFPSLAAQPEDSSDQNEAAMSGPVSHRKNWFRVGSLLFVAALSLPFWADGGLLYIAGSAVIYALFALSWNILFGYTGLASFGHAAFFAIGAYFTGVMLRDWPQVPFLLILLGCGVAGALVAGLLGALALRRLAGIFLAVLTIALGRGNPFADQLQRFPWPGRWTGGYSATSTGRSGHRPESILLLLLVPAGGRGPAYRHVVVDPAWPIRPFAADYSSGSRSRRFSGRECDPGAHYVFHAVRGGGRHRRRPVRALGAHRDTGAGELPGLHATGAERHARWCPFVLGAVDRCWHFCRPGVWDPHFCRPFRNDDGRAAAVDHSCRA